MVTKRTAPPPKKKDMKGKTSSMRSSPNFLTMVFVNFVQINVQMSLFTVSRIIVFFTLIVLIQNMYGVRDLFVMIIEFTSAILVIVLM